MIFINFFVGCGWGYGNYRNKNDERGPVFIFMTFDLLSSLIGFSVFLGVFWGGIRYALHVFFMR